MTTSSHALHLLGSFRAVGAAAGSTGTVAAGAAVSLGQGTGDSSDVFLCAGQSLQVAAGQSVVMEPLGGRRLQYRLARGDAASARPASWWRRASFGNGGSAHGTWGDACCA
jgi:hypothetical protein